MRLQKRYVGRYVLADGRPREFTVYAFNRSDADAAVVAKAREALSDEQRRAALYYGVEVTR
jgi:hypothetical protein